MQNTKERKNHTEMYNRESQSKELKVRGCKNDKGIMGKETSLTNL